MAAVDSADIAFVCDRLVNSDEYAGDEAIPAIAEDAKNLILELVAARDNLQAKVDALMLKYCPDEMTQAQVRNWEAHQVAAPNISV